MTSAKKKKKPKPHPGKPKRPILMYRFAQGGDLVYLKVPDREIEKDAILTFNRKMADLGFPDPEAIFDNKLGVAVVPAAVRIQKGGKLITYQLIQELGYLFRLKRIDDETWYYKRF